MTSPVARLVLEQIRAGTFTPDELAEIGQACLDAGLEEIPVAPRSGFAGVKVSANYAIGDRVMLVAPIRPTYLRGIHGTIIGRKIKRLEFRPDSGQPLDPRANRYIRGGVIGVTENMIQKL